MATPINSGGWSRRFVWASKASELADVGDDGSIKIKADANVMLTLQAHLQVGYNRTLARTSLSSPSSSTTPSWGGTFLASDAQGQQDSQSCVVQKLIALSEGDVITAEFRTATSAPHHHHHGNYMHSQAEQTELSQAFKTSLMLICC
ncbi:hypothetical protein EMIHUDRAFT_234287 [Emiliania huxleyi CCMP1516]|uniref:Uncharacterized protein n=2 Tax=Emiliania huxleyi TaxID=2903 RepID=A0A0D3JZW7_EMIH1|nr:hypothetical protein EMIHUDRAFT_234287 [Emiliania huxleyi CCMP1516]EOD29052.1 hypothetical protein EMIHUDRAFT_234287 [Emiliania huxleyi CCMP1516]|eukprot:XP_005781481.1 hypothetical protein EMIHUDRAFT_234287 [Emiliania huxleyi CCMP1516]